MWLRSFHIERVSRPYDGKCREEMVGEGGVQQRAATAEGNTKIFHCLHLNVVLVICFVVAVCLLSCSFHS